MEKITKYRAMDTILSDVQETTLSMGAIGRSSRQFQSWSRSRHRLKETVPQRGALLSCKIETRKKYSIFRRCRLIVICFLLQYLMKDVLRPYVPEYKGQVTSDDGERKHFTHEILALIE